MRAPGERGEWGRRGNRNRRGAAPKQGRAAIPCVVRCKPYKTVVSHEHRRPLHAEEQRAVVAARHDEAVGGGDELEKEVGREGGEGVKGKEGEWRGGELR